MIGKKGMYVLAMLSFLVVAALQSQAQTCSNASLNGKYVLAGQGDVLSGLLCGLGICTDSTFSTVGFITADGSGKISSARIFAASDSGVSDTSFTGKYSITNCDTGTVSLTSADGSTALDYDIDLDAVDSGNLAHAAAAVDSDTGINESLQLSRTVDPSGCGAGSTLLNGLTINGSEHGTFSGQKESGIVSSIFNNDGSTFSGTQKISTGNITTNAYTGKYTVNSDCSVTFTLSINGTTLQGAHIISGGDTQAPPLHDFALQGDALEPASLLDPLPGKYLTW